MKIIKEETSFMRDNEPAVDVDVTAVVSPTYKKAIEDREKIRARIKKELKGKEARKEPVLGTKGDKITLGESLFEDFNEEKKINEENELSSSPYKDKIGDYFDHSFDFEFLDVVADILERAIDEYDSQDENSKDLDNAIFEAIDEGLIYDADQWKVLEHYLTPQEANWEIAEEMLTNDIYSLAEDIIGEEGEDTDESLHEDAEGIEDEEDGDKGKSNSSLDLWTKVYDEIFGLKDTYKVIPINGNHGIADYTKFFDPRDHIEKHPGLGDDYGIGVKGADNIGRLEDVAKVMKLKVKRGKTGESAYVIIPKEYHDKRYTVWTDMNGIKLPKEKIKE